MKIYNVKRVIGLAKEIGRDNSLVLSPFIISSLSLYFLDQNNWCWLFVPYHGQPLSFWVYSEFYHQDNFILTSWWISFSEFRPVTVRVGLNGSGAINEIKLPTELLYMNKIKKQKEMKYSKGNSVIYNKTVEGTIEEVRRDGSYLFVARDGTETISSAAGFDGVLITPAHLKSQGFTERNILSDSNGRVKDWTRLIEEQDDRFWTLDLVMIQEGLWRVSLKDSNFREVAVLNEVRFWHDIQNLLNIYINE